jgi:multifunctional 2-oxoglutarate metabolism enzyme
MSGTFTNFGPNSGLVEDLYRQFQENPASVSEAWRDYFEDYEPAAPKDGKGAAPAPVAPARTAEPAPPAPPAEPARPATPAEAQLLRGAAARVVQNMEASLTVPTATSVRTVPAKLLEVNRQILNNQLARTGGRKVSFTHLIAYAAVQAVKREPAMRAGYVEVDGKPAVVHHEHVNLGLAVDLQRDDGSRTLLVPNIKQADTLDFAGFFAAYEDLIRSVRNGDLKPDDFAATTATITNPGMIGTVHSVPRLVAGQSFILGVGSIGYPAEYEGADPRTLAALGIGKVTTLTSTYDHRVIQGAESGEFLRWIHQLLLGAEGFYDAAFASLDVPYEPARWSTDAAAVDAGPAADTKATRVHQLVNMYRVRGHLIANLDPLGRRPPRTHPELDIAHYDLSIWDLDREFATDGLAGQKTMTLREIMGVLRDAYARTVGVEYMHIQEPDQKAWIQDRVEGVRTELSGDEKRRILDRLNAAEAFERFLHTKYLGHKRYSLEGAESLVPMLDVLLSEAADDGMSEVVLGMAHRGRLNVLANVLGKSYEQMFREFEGELDPMTALGSGDVKYHLGATGKHSSPAGNNVLVTMASNPSHLEAVDPVVEGIARAKADRSGPDSTLPVLVHGDAAFAGQGVVAETLNLSEVAGYDVGGTVHVVVDNQLGFTTAPEHGRSSVYATDVAKMVQAPIFHVNGDDPEAAVRVMRLAFEFRQQFRKDVVVDLVCYRRYGHNEADEPGYTQPGMYALIEAHRSVRKLYTEQLVNKGDLTMEEAEQALADFRARLEQAFSETHDSEPPSPAPAPAPDVSSSDPDTSVGRATLTRVVDAITSWPDGFAINPKLEKQLRAHRLAFDGDEVDWSLAETLAIGSLVLDGTAVRLAGQDTRRGTFSQRHGVLVDMETEAEYIPLANLAPEQAPYMLYDSVLSEYAALGFEYGYSIAAPDALVLWEAQFGDFANGAQIVIDQFVVAAEDKWGQHSSLGLLLPHAFEGQGPEHSSARLERFLTLCAEDNLRVVAPTTAAQYFHALRRQALADRKVPMIALTPKRYLRMPDTKSPVGAFTDGGFEVVLDDRNRDLDAVAVQRVLLSAGKVGHELMGARDERSTPVAVVRIEQLYPFPAQELDAVLARYPNATELVWVQEEPANMGAWGFVRERLTAVADGRPVLLIAREASASPASGSQTVHEREQHELLETALGEGRASG